MAQQRNNAISIAKGFAIIFVVMAHADMPGMLNRAIYLFHMPLFFITAGYFFKHETVENPWPFIVKRFKGLYVPFVKWSIFFLLIHNLLFKIGILNEVYGNWTGGTTHPYSIHQFWQRFTNIVFSMGGYDEFLAGAFWFFRGLLVASIAFVVLYYMLNNVKRLRGRTVAIPLVIFFIALGFALLSHSCRVATATRWACCFSAAACCTANMSNASDTACGSPLPERLSCLPDHGWNAVA